MKERYFEATHRPDFSGLRDRRVDNDVDPTPFDLWRTAGSITKELADKAEHKGLVLELRYAFDAPRFLIGDGAGIRRVLFRLVDRAITLARRGRVSIDIQGDRCVEGSAAMRLRVEATGVEDPQQLMAGVAGDIRPDIPERRAGLRLEGRTGSRIGVLGRPGEGTYVWLALSLPLDALDTGPRYA